MFSCKGRVNRKILQTLGFFIKDGKIWLGEKIGGKDFGRGRLNGFGGAVIQFFFENEPAKIREVHVFWVSDCRGEPTGSKEMTVQGFPLKEVGSLYDRMWAGDRLWLPMFLEGKKFRGEVLYDSPENNNVISKEFWEVEEL